jgi:alkanesulfonate monooxygenase SsuD/methylene tetrahydromethanopterin reductase-like flavin-dependent oxidoreductase (luciferase family)
MYPRPIQQPNPPLWVAGSAEKAIDRAARLGDYWLCGPTEPIDVVQADKAVYDRSCQQVGRSPDWVLRRYGWIAPSRKVLAEEVIPPYVEGLLEHWRDAAEVPENRELIRRIDAGEDISAESIADDRLLWGSPDDVIAQIERYRQAAACDHMVVAFGTGLTAKRGPTTAMGSFQETAAMVRLFAREVMPAFA